MKAGGGHVRRTPKRRRTTCAECGRDVAWTKWPGADPVFEGRKNLANHNSAPGVRCPGSGRLQ
jgi:hypothetical protein